VTTNDTNTTELDTVETVDGELVAPLSEKEAKALDKKVRAARAKVTTTAGTLVDRSEVLLDLIEQAARGEIHKALGVSWPAWFKDAAQIQPVNRAERKSLVALMSGKQLSQRLVADVLGVSKGTVQNDQCELEQGGQGCPLPENVVSLNGTTQPRKHNKSEPETVEPEPESSDNSETVDPETVEPQPQSKQPPLTDDFRDAVPQIRANIELLLDSLADDRFPEARSAIKKAFLDDLLDAKNGLERVIAEVGGLSVSS